MISRCHKKLDRLVQIVLGTVQILAFQERAQIICPADAEIILLFRGHLMRFIDEIVGTFGIAGKDEVISLILAAFNDLVTSTQGFEEIETLHQIAIGFLKLMQLGEHRAQIPVKFGLDVIIAHCGQQFQTLEI